MSSIPPRLTEAYRRVSRDKFYWYQAHRHLLSGMHMSLAASALSYDIIHRVRQPDDPLLRLQRLDTLALVLTILGRVIWGTLFANIDKFCGFRRPGRAYVLAVWFATAITTVPNLAVHVPLFRLSMQVSGVIGVSRAMRIAQPVFLLLSCAFHAYLVQRFLMRDNERHYEPTCELLMGSRPSRGFMVEGMPSDAVSVVSLPSYRDEDEPYEDAPDSFLSAAYAKQSERRRRPSILEANAPAHGNGHEHTGANGEETTHTQESSQPSGCSRPTTAALSLTLTPDRKRCPTVARFDYMPENHSTVNSIVAYPILSWVFGIFAVILAYMIIRLSIENAKGGFPSAYVTASEFPILLLAQLTLMHRIDTRDTPCSALSAYSCYAPT